MRPPRTFSRLIAKAAKVATTSVRMPVIPAMNTEFQSCSQKWLRK